MKLLEPENVQLEDSKNVFLFLSPSRLFDEQQTKGIFIGSLENWESLFPTGDVETFYVN